MKTVADLCLELNADEKPILLEVRPGVFQPLKPDCLRRLRPVRWDAARGEYVEATDRATDPLGLTVTYAAVLSPVAFDPRQPELELITTDHTPTDLDLSKLEGRETVELELITAPMALDISNAKVAVGPRAGWTGPTEWTAEDRASGKEPWEMPDRFPGLTADTPVRVKLLNGEREEGLVEVFAWGRVPATGFEIVGLELAS